MNDTARKRSQQRATPQKSHPLEKVPQCLRDVPQWILWRSIPVDGVKPRKEPWQATRDARAKTNDPSTWCDYKTAMEHYRHGYHAGLGFVFTADNDFCGVDLDNCRNPETKKIDDWAKEIIAKFNTYTETSPSLTGFKLFCRGKWSGSKNKFWVDKKLEKQIEVYDHVRYFAITGLQKFGVSTDVHSRQEELDWLADKYLQKNLLARYASVSELFTPPMHVLERARRYIARIPAAISGQGGHDQTFRVACVLVIGFDLSRDDALMLLGEYNHGCEPPWSDKELEHKINDAIKQPGDRGYLLNDSTTPALNELSRKVELTNCDVVTVADEKGNDKQVHVPLSLKTIIKNILSARDGWPRRVGNTLFVDDPQHGLRWFDRSPAAGVFGWLQGEFGGIHWRQGPFFVTKQEAVAELDRTTKQYDAIEQHPHEPPIDGIYYRCQTPPPGDGEHLRQLLDRFRPETDIDRDLIQAALMTVLWGGQPGARPAIVITSDEGRGVGKTKLAEMCAYLVGGHIDVSAGERIADLKSRLLSPAASIKRVALLDNVKTAAVLGGIRIAHNVTHHLWQTDVYRRRDATELAHLDPDAQRDLACNRHGTTERHHQTCWRREHGHMVRGHGHVHRRPSRANLWRHHRGIAGRTVCTPQVHPLGKLGTRHPVPPTQTERSPASDRRAARRSQCGTGRS